MPAALALPLLDHRRAVERAHLTRLQLSHERALEAHLAATLGRIGRNAALLFKRDDAIEAVTIRNDLVRILRPSLVETARTFADRLRHHPKCAHAFEAKAFEDHDAAITEFMAEHVAEMVVGVAESTRTAIMNAIRQGQEDGLSGEEIAQAIVEATAGEIGLARARRIARTETHNAAMFGQQAAAEASPLDFNKTWLATEDKRTRADHAEANRQTVALDEMFVVGGHEMAHPGDTSAPPEQIINCRCVAMYEPA